MLPPDRARFASSLRLGRAIALAWLLVSAGRADEPRPLESYFRTETERIARTPLLRIESAADWQRRRPELQRQLREMLGLDPLPARTSLKAEVRGIVDRPDFVVERVVFQSLPGLYVTGNLYRPKEVGEPLPAVLYVCGHARVEEDGVIYGCKAHYQHHAAWFAANGYVCLVVDTLQLGEVPGLHHGTYREGMLWWQSRGYTPAGVEAWNGIRAIDYLVSRPEVDPGRLGVTGRSGGGATSWWLGALDDRLKVVVPVAGITDLHDHVISGNPDVAHPRGVIEGHCDCMFTVNTYRWDYTVVAALVAPKALLVENTDRDPIFPERGVRRIFEQLETVYEWYDDREKLDLVIGSGGHVDSEEIRHRAFAWFERWMKGREVAPSAIEEPDRRVPIQDLKVLDAGEPLPPNRNDAIEESFVATRSGAARPIPLAGWERARGRILGRIRSQVFGGWPSDEEAGSLIVDRPYRERTEGGSTEIVKGGLAVTAYDFWTELHPDPRLRIWSFHRPGREGPIDHDELIVLDAAGWDAYGGLIEAFEAEGGDPSGHPHFEVIRAKVDGGVPVLLFAPLGIGPTAWPEEQDTHIRRRFALLGQTLDGMRVLDVRRAIRCVTPSDGRPLWIAGRGDAAALALWAAVFEPEVDRIVLHDPPESVRDGPPLLNLERVLDMPRAVTLLYPRPVEIRGSRPEVWAPAREQAEALGAGESWPEIGPRGG